MIGGIVSLNSVGSISIRLLQPMAESMLEAFKQQKTRILDSKLPHHMPPISAPSPGVAPLDLSLTLPHYNPFVGLRSTVNFS